MPTPNPAHNPNVDLWECPCRECTRLEYNAQRTTGMLCGPTETGGLSITAFRAREWPEIWGTPAPEQVAFTDAELTEMFSATPVSPQVPAAPTPQQLHEALAYVEENGFGDDVDADSIIEQAARLYLGNVITDGLEELS
jgi:hypothetical protein